MSHLMWTAGRQNKQRSPSFEPLRAVAAPDAASASASAVAALRDYEPAVVHASSSSVPRRLPSLYPPSPPRLIRRHVVQPPPLNLVCQLHAALSSHRQWPLLRRAWRRRRWCHLIREAAAAAATPWVAGLRVHVVWLLYIFRSGTLLSNCGHCRIRRRRGEGTCGCRRDHTRGRIGGCCCGGDRRSKDDRCNRRRRSREYIWC